MTEQELKKLSRADLLELLLSVSEENARLRRELDEAREQLESRRIEVAEAGTLAEAAMKLNGIFAAADAACAQYTENIQLMKNRQERICERMEADTRARCAEMLAETERAIAAAKRRAAMQATDRSPERQPEPKPEPAPAPQAPTVRVPRRRMPTKE